jgi:hypothetical protein
MQVIEWMDYHKNDVPQSEEDDDNIRESGTNDISDWDRDFLNVSKDLLFELISVCLLSFIQPFI